MSERLRETIKTLEKRIEDLGHQNGELQRELRLQEARHQHEVEHDGEEHQKALLAALDEIQRLKDELKQSSTALVTARAPTDLEQELRDAYDENARLVEFVQTVADATRTKFSEAARTLLGQ